MYRGLAAKAIFTESIPALEQVKSAGRDYQMHKPRHGANRAIAMLNGYLLSKRDFKLYPPTVATAACLDQIHDGSVFKTTVCVPSATHTTPHRL